MTDTINMPREVVEQALKALDKADELLASGAVREAHLLVATTGNIFRLSLSAAAEQPSQQGAQDAVNAALGLTTKPEPVGVNGLTYEETSATASVMGLTAKPETQGERAEVLYLVMAGGDCFQSCIVPESKLDDTYLLMQWVSLKDIDPEQKAASLAHFHDDDEWTHEQATGSGQRIEFSINFEDGWIKVIRLPTSAALLSASTAPAVQDAAKPEQKRNLFQCPKTRMPCISDMCLQTCHAESAKPEPCPDSRSDDHACKNRHQCWEPCGELGHSMEHARPAPKETQDAVNAALGLAAKPLRAQEIKLTDAQRKSLTVENEVHIPGVVMAHACQACGAPATRHLPEEATSFPGPYCDECGPGGKSAAKPETQGEQPLLVRDLAEIICKSVPAVSAVISELGLGNRSTNMAMHPDEAIAVAKRFALLSAGPARVEPLTTFVRNLAKAYTDEARGLLDETYRFASQSPRGRDNINAVLQLLDDIDSALEPSKPVQGIGKDQA